MGGSCLGVRDVGRKGLTLSPARPIHAHGLWGIAPAFTLAPLAEQYGLSAGTGGQDRAQAVPLPPSLQTISKNLF